MLKLRHYCCRQYNDCIAKEYGTIEKYTARIRIIKVISRLKKYLHDTGKRFIFYFILQGLVFDSLIPLMNQFSHYFFEYGTEVIICFLLL